VIKQKTPCKGSSLEPIWKNYFSLLCIHKSKANSYCIDQWNWQGSSPDKVECGEVKFKIQRGQGEFKIQREKFKGGGRLFSQECPSAFHIYSPTIMESTLAFHLRAFHFFGKQPLGKQSCFPLV